MKVSKQLKRQRKKQKRKDREQRKVNDVTIHIHGKCPLEYINAVITATKNILTTSNGRNLFKSLKDCGTDYYSLRDQRVKAECLLGQLVLKSLPVNIINTYMQAFSVDFVIQNAEDDLHIYFKQMRKMKTGQGLCYFSPHLPMFDYNNQKLIASFSRHAIERIAVRMVYSYDNYWGYGDVFASIYHCVYYEPYQYGFKVWKMCASGFFSEAIAKQVLQIKTLRPSLYYLAGYCPIVICGNMAVAKTMITPGCKGTPEKKWYKSVYGENEALDGIMHKLTSYRGLCNVQDFSILRKFHHEGNIPQVKVIPHKVYNYEIL